jgi:hypothetical protein
MVKRIQQSGTNSGTSSEAGSGSGSGTGSGPVEEVVGFSELVKGASLKIYYGEDGKTIEKALYQPQRF